MMLQDRFVKVMLVIIAVLLALNLVKPAVSLFSSPAQAQVTRGVGTQAKRFDVKAVRGYEVKSLQDVVVLGDGKSFVVSNPNGFMVYTYDQFGN
jgi:hypothetical protein